MHITVQTGYDLQYFIMHLSDYMNAPTEPSFIALRHGMKYLMHHAHEHIMFSGKKINKTDEIPHQCYFKEGDSYIRKMRTTLTSFTHIVMQIMPEIFLTDFHSNPQFISSMLPSKTGVPGNNEEINCGFE